MTLVRQRIALVDDDANEAEAVKISLVDAGYKPVLVPDIARNI